MMAFTRILFLIFIMIPSFLYAGGSSDEDDRSPKYPAKRRCSATKQKVDKQGTAKSVEDLPHLSYLAYAAHEIKNQLGGLQALDFIKHEHLNGDDLEYLQMAQASARATLSLTTQILNASSLETGRVKLSREKLNPVVVAEETMEQLAFEANQKGIKLELLTPIDELGVYWGDPTRLGEIFFNLIHNAIKFTNEGGVQLVLRGIQERQHFVLEGDVIDTGGGMPPEIQDTLFKPFSHANGSKHPGRGMGLGLFITKELCALMGGEIKVKSQMGKGSAFLFKVTLEYVSD
jgi:signal transduction histidine kinase